MIDLSIVILTWNSRDLLSGALRAVAATVRTAHEVIVVDNGSTDGTVAMLRAEFPEVRLIENAENRGVAAARNQGLALATGRYRLLLDVDTEAQPEALDRLIAFMDEHPNVGVCGAKLVHPDGTVQTSCRRLPSAIMPILNRLTWLPGVKGSRPYRHQHMLDRDRAQPMAVDYLLGACQLIRAETWAVAGPLDEAIFYGPEDADFCLRVWQAGWEVWYVPTATVVHLYRRITRNLWSPVTRRHAVAWVHFFRKHRYLFRPPQAAP